jgi:hypothetical protein
MYFGVTTGELQVEKQTVGRTLRASPLMAAPGRSP